MTQLTIPGPSGDDHEPTLIAWPDDAETARRMRALSNEAARVVVAERTAYDQVLASKFSHAHKLELLFALAGDAQCVGCEEDAHQALHQLLDD